MHVRHKTFWCLSYICAKHIHLLSFSTVLFACSNTTVFISVDESRSSLQHAYSTISNPLIELQTQPSFIYKPTVHPNIIRIPVMTPVEQVVNHLLREKVMRKAIILYSTNMGTYLLSEYGIKGSELTVFK